MKFDHTERKHIEEVMRLQAEILAHMSEGVTLVRTSDATFVYTNPTYEKMLGYDAGELAGQHVAVVNDPAAGLPEKTAADIIGQLREHGMWQGEVHNQRKDGTKIWCRSVVTRFDHPQYGEVWLGVNRDITAERIAEQSTREAHERYEGLVRRIPCGVYMFRVRPDRSVHVDYASQRTADLFGVPLAELQKDASIWYRCAHPDEKPDIESVSRQTIERVSDFAWEGRFLTGDQTRWLRIYGKPVAQPNGDVVWNGVVNDITESKNLELALRASEEKHRLLFEQAGDAMLVVTPEHRIVAANEAACSQLGYSHAELLGMNTRQIVTDEIAPQLAEVVERVRKRGERIMEMAFRRKNGSVLPVENHNHLIEWEGRECCLVICRDLTERKQMEERLRKSQQMEAVGHLAGGMAHEFNNILASMMLSLSLARIGGEGTDRELLLDDLEESCKRSADLIKQLLAFSRQSFLNQRMLNLGEVIAAQARTLRPFLSDKIHFDILVPEDLPPVNSDQALIEQVLLNLCLNARDAMPSGGQLRLELRLEKVGAEHSKAHADARPGSFVCLLVKDTGCGMDHAVKKRLFEPFFTTRKVGQGTGLGLATVRGIVQQHQGWVEVESEPGKGSTFRVYLPAGAPAGDSVLPLARAQAPHVSPALSPTRTILVVEDDAKLRRLSVMMLTRKGYRVLEAEDGASALMLWETHRQEIDLLYSDMVMPGASTGLQLAERMRVDKPDLRVIITSGYNTSIVDIEKAAAADIAYLPKPCPAEMLLEVVERCLHSNAPAT